MSRRLEGMVALITGASSGLGKATALAMAFEGARVGINHFDQAEAAETLAGKIREAGGEALAVAADVRDPEQVAAMFRRLLEHFGRIDILVNNAGIQADAPFLEMKPEEWQRVLDTDLTGPFLCAQLAARQFMRQGVDPARSPAAGKILCVTSVHDRIPWRGHANYTAAKGGARMLMETMAQELAPHRIRVNALAPGAIRTPINRRAWDSSAALDALLDKIPYGRIGEPEDVARAAVWLCSDESDYVTGTTLYVDGGMMLFPAFQAGG